MRSLLFALSFLSLASCAPKSSTTTAEIKNSSIINGTDVKKGDTIASSTVSVYNVKEQYICTGSLIASNIVMTAAHCAPTRASNIKIVFALDVDDMMGALEPDVKDEYILQATDFRVGKTWNPQDEKREIDTGDIALIKFKGNLPPGFKPATFLADESLLKIGAMVTVAGYGVDNVDISKEINLKTYVTLEEDIESGEVTCEDQANGKHIKCFKVEMTGDGILRKTKAPISSIQETEVNLNEKQAGTCSGDSGGPAFLEKDGAFYLFGVTSRGSGLCNDVGVYTNALYYKQWIEDTSKLLK